NTSMDLQGTKATRRANFSTRNPSCQSSQKNNAYTKTERNYFDLDSIRLKPLITTQISTFSHQTQQTQTPHNPKDTK
ncbi:hypothetical protein K8353_50460, partial [Burkholderia contaminans]|nr:hypothetical protein [Burkholderia contaminans]